METKDFDSLRSAVERLVLNDPAVSVEKDSSPALGQGWRLGFLGILHMEVFGQRLEDEYQADVILCAPSVPYKALIKVSPAPSLNASNNRPTIAGCARDSETV